MNMSCAIVAWPPAALAAPAAVLAMAPIRQIERQSMVSKEHSSIGSLPTGPRLDRTRIFGCPVKDVARKSSRNSERLATRFSLTLARRKLPASIDRMERDGWTGRRPDPDACRSG